MRFTQLGGFSDCVRVLLDDSKRVAQIQLNRPNKSNAFDAALWREFPRAVRAVQQMPDTRVVSAAAPAACMRLSTSSAGCKKTSCTAAASGSCRSSCALQLLLLPLLWRCLVLPLLWRCRTHAHTTAGHHGSRQELLCGPGPGLPRRKLWRKDGRRPPRQWRRLPGAHARGFPPGDRHHAGGIQRDGGLPLPCHCSGARCASTRCTRE